MRYKPRCLAVKSVLILPECWGSGAALLLIDEMAPRARAKGYQWIDLSLTSEDNPYTCALPLGWGRESTNATASTKRRWQTCLPRKTAMAAGQALAYYLTSNPPSGQNKFIPIQ